MSKRKEAPRRRMTKVRRCVGKPTMVEMPKNIYNRNEWKEETKAIIENECLCVRGRCCCGEEEE